MAEVKKWHIDDFDIGRKIGTGRFGNVYITKEKGSNFVLAIKMIKKSDIQENDLHNQLKREIEIHSHLINPNILRLYGYFHDENRVYLMIELAPHGELYTDLQRYGCYSDERTATYMYQLILALQYCHARNVMHRDIKPENVLIASKGQIKLADFGWSVHNKTGQRNTMCGTLDYLPPEMLEHSAYTKEIDIWCSGILLYEMQSSSVPFENDSEQVTMELIKRVEFTIPDMVDPYAEDMIKKILVFNPENRLTLEQMLEHPFIKKYSENTTNECKAAFEMWRTGRISDYRPPEIDSESD